MDLLNFDADDLYFDTEQDPVVTELLSGAAEAYGTPAAEQRLLRAYFHAPAITTTSTATTTPSTSPTVHCSSRGSGWDSQPTR